MRSGRILTALLLGVPRMGAEDRENGMASSASSTRSGKSATVPDTSSELTRPAMLAEEEREFFGLPSGPRRTGGRMRNASSTLGTMMSTSKR